MIKKLLVIIVLLFIFIFLFPKVFTQAAELDYESGTKQEIISILKQAEGSAAYGYIIKDAELREADVKESKVIGRLYEGERVEVLEDKTKKYYRVRVAATDEIGWIIAAAIRIDEDKQADKSKMNGEDKERFAEIIGFKSETNNFVWVDIARQEVNVFEKQNGELRLIKTFACSSGKNESPTMRGFFTIKDRGVWFYSERLKSGAKYWLRFHGSYLFHSVPMNRSEKIIDSTIGEKSSSGCVRMALPDAEWFYNNIEDGTGVFIN